MASSFLAQIPVIVGVLNQLRPKTILDVGKGFGKYGCLAHEYVGIDHQRRPDPARTLAQQSCVHIDAVEWNRDYLWPHIEQLYRRVFVGRVEDMLSQLPNYDVVLMCDVIEHIEKQGGANVVRHFVKSGAAV